MYLVVTDAFEGRARGDVVTDPDDIERILFSGNSHRVASVCGVLPPALFVDDSASRKE